MKSKKSLCNITLYKNDIHRFWPLALFYTILLQLMITLPTFSELYSYHIDSFRTKEEILYHVIEIINYGFVPCFAGICFAVIVFHYLNKEKESYGLHAMPIRRETMFGSHYFAGLTLLILPMLFTLLLLLIMGFVFEIQIEPALFAGFAYAIIENFFFYNLACLVTMLTSNSLMTAIIYIVLNGLLPGTYMLFEGLREIYLYNPGTSRLGSWIFKYTPIPFFMKHCTLISYSKEYLAIIEAGAMDILSIILTIIPAFVFIVLSIYFYKKRNLETAGEVVVFNWGRTVFRVVFTVCGSMVLTIILYYILCRNLMIHKNYTQQFPVVLVLLLLCIILFYWLSNVILYRSIHVRKYTSPVKCGIILIVMAVIFIATKDFHLSIKESDVRSIQVDVDLYYDNEHYDYESTNLSMYKIENAHFNEIKELILQLQNEGQQHPIDDYDRYYGQIRISIDTEKDSQYLSFAIYENNQEHILQVLESIGTKVSYDTTR